MVRFSGLSSAHLQPDLLPQGQVHRNGTSGCIQFDLKNKRIFLKRCEYALQLKDIFLGAVLNVYSRQLKVVDYADEFTRTKFEVQKGKYSNNNSEGSFSSLLMPI